MSASKFRATHLFVGLFLIVALTGCGSNPQPAAPAIRGAVEVGPLEIGLSVNANGEVTVVSGLSTPKIRIGLGPVTLRFGIEDSVQLTQQRKYMLYVVWQDAAGQTWRDEYEVGQKFRVTFNSQEHVREIRGENDSIIVVVERTSDTAPIPTTASIPTPQIPTVRARDVINLRTGPGTNYPIVGQTQEGSTYRITGKSSDGNWWQVCCQGGEAVWLAASLVETSGPVSGVKEVASKNVNLPQISGFCPPDKCHIEGFTGGFLIASYGQTFGLFNSGRWFVESIPEQEARAVTHFDCATKPDLDQRVRWGFNIAYCRFHDRGFKLGDPIDEGGPIEGNVFNSTAQGIEVDFKGWYGRNGVLIKEDGTWRLR